MNSLNLDEADTATFQQAVEGNANADSIVSGQTFSELAENFGVDPDVLQAQVDRYNEYCKSGADLDFGKDPTFLIPIETSPFYMARIVPLHVVIIGGVTCNVRAEVLDQNLETIPGLYAVGLEGAMLHRNVYTQNMPGSNMANNVNSGRNAAKNARAYLGK